MEVAVRGPDIDPDEASAVLVAGTQPGPIHQLAAQADTAIPAAHGQSPHVDRRVVPQLLWPDAMVVRASCERRHRPLPVPGDPGPARRDRPDDALVPAVLIGPGGS